MRRAWSLELVCGNGMCYITMLFGGCCVILCELFCQSLLSCSNRSFAPSLFCCSVSCLKLRSKLRKSSEVRCCECSMMKVLSLHRYYCTCFE